MENMRNTHLPEGHMTIDFRGSKVPKRTKHADSRKSACPVIILMCTWLVLVGALADFRGHLNSTIICNWTLLEEGDANTSTTAQSYHIRGWF